MKIKKPFRGVLISLYTTTTIVPPTAAHRRNRTPRYRIVFALYCARSSRQLWWIFASSSRKTVVDERTVSLNLSCWLWKRVLDRTNDRKVLYRLRCRTGTTTEKKLLLFPNTRNKKKLAKWSDCCPTRVRCRQKFCN